MELLSAGSLEANSRDGGTKKDAVRSVKTNKPMCEEKKSEMKEECACDVTVFLFEGAHVRTVGTEDAPLFCAKDVCDILGLKNPSVAVAALDEDERSKFNLGRQGDGLMVTESGLYHLVFKSRKAAAVRFRRWVTQEVLPELRRRGFYAVLRGRELVTLPEWLVAQGVDVRRQKAEAKRLLKRAWEASKLLGYRDKRVDEANGLVVFPQEVLGLAEEGDLARVEMRGEEAERVQRVMERMEPGREYSVDEVAVLGGFSGSVAKVRSDVGRVMGRVVGLGLGECVLGQLKRQRRRYYVLNRKGDV